MRRLRDVGFALLSTNVVKADDHSWNGPQARAWGGRSKWWPNRQVSFRERRQCGRCSRPSLDHLFLGVGGIVSIPARRDILPQFRLPNRPPPAPPCWSFAQMKCSFQCTNLDSVTGMSHHAAFCECLRIFEAAVTLDDHARANHTINRIGHMKMPP